MKKINLVLPTIAGMILLSACGGTSGQATTDAGTGSNRPAESTSETAPTTTEAAPTTTEAAPTTTEAAPTTTEAAAANPVFDEAYKFENELEVTVSAPAPFTPSDSAAASPAPSYVIFDVTVVNGSKSNYDPNLFSSSLQSGNAEATQVFDSAKDIGGGATTAVLPGREVTFKTAWGVTDPADLVMQVQPGFEYDAAIFTS